MSIAYQRDNVLPDPVTTKPQRHVQSLGAGGRPSLWICKRLSEKDSLVFLSLYVGIAIVKIGTFCWGAPS